MIIEALAQAAGILCFVTGGVMPDTTRASTSSASTMRASAGRWCPAISWCSRRNLSARSRVSGASPPWRCRRPGGGARGHHGSRRRARQVIDPRAIVSPPGAAGAGCERRRLLASSVRRSSIGAGTVIGPHAVINGPTSHGRRQPHLSVRLASAMRRRTRSIAASRRGLRSAIATCFASAAPSTAARRTTSGVTRIGNDNLFMAYSHVAHDCRSVTRSCSPIARCSRGHVEIGDWVILGGLPAVHQFSKIGAHAFLAGNAIVHARRAAVRHGRRAIPARRTRSTAEGLKRRGFTEEQIRNIRDAYRILYRSDLQARRGARRSSSRWPRRSPSSASSSTSSSASVRSLVR